MRLILAILALLLSLPATAAPACHAASTAAATGQATATAATKGHAHHAPKTAALADAHLCVGCAPLGDWLRAPLGTPMMTQASAPIARVATLDLGKAFPPALPPPRLG